MRILTSLAIIVAVAALTGIGSTSAHNLGSSIETVKDGYLIDMGYSPEVITNGTQTRFDYALYDHETMEAVPFDNIWFRIEQNNKVYFAGGLTRQNFGQTGMTYRFTEPGNYELYIRYGTGTNSIVETTNMFQVLEAPDTRSIADKIADNAAGLGSGLFIGLGLMWFISRRNKKYAR